MTGRSRESPLRARTPTLSPVIFLLAVLTTACEEPEEPPPRRDTPVEEAPAADRIIPSRACEPGLGDPPPDASALPEGPYRLVLVAGAGAEGFTTVEGDLFLVPQEAWLRAVPGALGAPVPDARMPLRGTAEIELARVGAATQGSLGSEDPSAPGVAVLQLPPFEGATLPRILVRLGSDLNRRVSPPLDGAYTVFRVKGLSEEGFFGSWESGGANGRMEGHFCAWRGAGGAAEL